MFGLLLKCEFLGSDRNVTRLLIRVSYFRFLAREQSPFLQFMRIDAVKPSDCYSLLIRLSSVDLSQHQVDFGQHSEAQESKFFRFILNLLIGTIRALKRIGVRFTIRPTHVVLALHDRTAFELNFNHQGIRIQLTRNNDAQAEH